MISKKNPSNLYIYSNWFVRVKICSIVHHQCIWREQMHCGMVQIWWGKWKCLSTKTEVGKPRHQNEKKSRLPVFGALLSAVNIKITYKSHVEHIVETAKRKYEKSTTASEKTTTVCSRFRWWGYQHSRFLWWYMLNERAKVEWPRGPTT